MRLTVYVTSDVSGADTRHVDRKHARVPGSCPYLIVILFTGVPTGVEMGWD